MFKFYLALDALALQLIRIIFLNVNILPQTVVEFTDNIGGLQVLIFIIPSELLFVL